MALNDFRRLTGFVDSHNSTETALDNGESFTGQWVQRSTSELILAIAADQDCTYKIQFSPDGGTNIDSTLTYSFEAGVVEVPKRLVISRDYYRVVITNDSGSNMTYLRAQLSVGDFGIFSSPINGIVSQDHDATVVRNIPVEFELPLGKYIGLELRDRWGANADVDSAGNEDIWDGGGVYTGFPTGAPEEVEIVLSDVGDVGGDITFSYTAAAGDTSWSTATITTTGTSTSTGITAYRVGRGIWDPGSATTNNAGTITARHVTTTANVFFVITIGRGQSSVCGERILSGHKAVLKSLMVDVFKTNTAAITGSIYVRQDGMSPRYIRPFSASDSVEHVDKMYGGELIEGPADIIVHVDTCSANNTSVSAILDYVLVKN